MFIYNMHRDRKFLMAITNSAALFLELFEPPSWFSLTFVAGFKRATDEGSLLEIGPTGHEFICETSHVLLAGVSGGFSPGTPVFAPPTD